MPLTTNDSVDHPAHYTGHPSGIECITITEHMGFCLGNAVKYLWRADLKGDAIEDLRKAAWYIQREIEKRERAAQEIRDAVEFCDARPVGGPPFVCNRLAGHAGDHQALTQGELVAEWPQ